MYIIECKDYSSKPIPVDDIEEFYAKIIQVSGVNTKAVFITSNTFQSGAYTYANSKGMMLIEVNANLTYNIVLHKTNLFNEQKIEANFLNDETEELLVVLKDQLAIKKAQRLIEKKIIQSFVLYVRGKSFNRDNYGLQYLSKKHIEEITTQLISSIGPTIQISNAKFDFYAFIISLRQVFDLSIEIDHVNTIDDKGRRILSYCSFVEKKIVIDKSINKTNRYKFTLAHEIGHFILHNKLQIDQNAYEKSTDSQQSFRLDRYILKNDRNWVEWQANQFAASLIMPEKIIFHHFSAIQDSIGLRPGSKLYVDEQKCNRNSFYLIVGKLSKIFQTTKTSIIYRLDSLNLLNENYKVKHISHIMETMKELMDSIEICSKENITKQ